jgi:hypothetical protein
MTSRYSCSPHEMPKEQYAPFLLSQLHMPPYHTHCAKQSTANTLQQHTLCQAAFHVHGCSETHIIHELFSSSLSPMHSASVHPAAQVPNVSNTVQ